MLGKCGICFSTDKNVSQHPSGGYYCAAHYLVAGEVAAQNREALNSTWVNRRGDRRMQEICGYNPNERQQQRRSTQVTQEEIKTLWEDA